MNYWFEIAKESAAIIIAGLALLLTVSQGWQTRKHNRLSNEQNERQARLSVKPYLTVFRRSGGNYYKIILANYGVGPAIIKSFKLSSKDRTVSLNNNSTYKKFLNEKMEEFRDKRTAHRGPNSAVKMGEEIALWEFKYAESQKGQNFKDIQELVLRIEYQSIYKDEVFIYDTIENRKFIEQDSI